MSQSKREVLKAQLNGSENTSKVSGNKLTNNKITNDRGFAAFLKFFGVIILIIGFIVGVIDGNGSSSFSFAGALVYWVSGTITGIFFIGFGVIIQLVHEINERNKNTSISTINVDN